MKKISLMIGCLAILFPLSVGARTTSPEGGKVYFLAPKNGETVSNPVTVIFGLKGMGVAPALIDKPNTGHHHLIIDDKLPPFDQPIPKTPHSRHFGDGQTETTLEFSPGKHTLKLLLGDHQHVPHDPPIYSEEITITVR